jgi:hypothetical protein
VPLSVLHKVDGVLLILVGSVQLLEKTCRVQIFLGELVGVVAGGVQPEHMNSLTNLFIITKLKQQYNLEMKIWSSEQVGKW